MLQSSSPSLPGTTHRLIRPDRMASAAVPSRSTRLWRWSTYFILHNSLLGRRRCSPRLECHFGSLGRHIIAHYGRVWANSGGGESGQRARIHGEQIARVIGHSKCCGAGDVMTQNDGIRMINTLSYWHCFVLKGEWTLALTRRTSFAFPSSFVETQLLACGVRIVRARG